MLLQSYSKTLFRPDCNHNFTSLNCIAHLDQDVREVIPYLNASLGGTKYIDDPPAVSFMAHGRLITVHADKIAVNALYDEEEADRILQWIKQEINETWENRDQIEPSFHTPKPPPIIEILKRLPRTNCGECREPTCMVFAVHVAAGGRDPEECPAMDAEQREELTAYVEGFDRND